MSTLKVGDIIEYPKAGSRSIVYFVNDSRAALVPESSPGLEYRRKDGEIQFRAGDGSESISPNSEVKVIQSLGREGLLEFLENKTQTKKEPKMAKNKTDDGQPRSKGRLGDFERCMAWTILDDL